MKTIELQTAWGSMRNSEEMKRWLEDEKKEFNALPEN